MTVRSMYGTVGVGMAALTLGVLSAPAGNTAEPSHTILVEAEAFDDLGGWVTDTQVMDQMGSPFLMAHGLGRPVDDASTRVAFPVAGTYRVLVRTRDWAAPWNAPEAPGRFEVLVSGEPLPAVFGTVGAEWHWHEGGIVEITEANLETSVTLRDLTGFNGRCDAIVFTTDAEFVPPNQGVAMARFRREALSHPEKPDDAGPYDLVVVGGGMAGTCAAISAARLGLSVALIQDRPVLGGVYSSELRIDVHGRIHQQPYPALGNVVRELGRRTGKDFGPPEQYSDERKLDVVRAERTLELFLNTRVNEVEMDRSRITAVVGQDVRTGRRTRFPARWFVDSTGDGNVGYLAGADYRYGRENRAETGEDLAPDEPDGMVMGASVNWTSTETDEPVAFPETPWAIQFTAENYQEAISSEPRGPKHWLGWETGFYLHQVRQAEKIRDHGLRAAFGNWSFQKNHAPDKHVYANRELEWVAYIVGKRESRRLLGDVVLRQQDIEEHRTFPDASAAATWGFDLHYPDPKQQEQFPDEIPFRARAAHGRRHRPYPIPYRCFYSRNVDNLFMAGRNISVTHVALGTVRVMNTLGMVGEVVGMAAAVCKRHDANPRKVYTDHLDDLKELMTEGIPPSGQKRIGESSRR